MTADPGLTGDLTPDLRRRLRILADMLPVLEAPDFEAGRWHRSEQRADGVWTMPWYELNAAGMAFTSAVGEAGFMLIGFAWPGRGAARLTHHAESSRLTG